MKTLLITLILLAAIGLRAADSTIGNLVTNSAAPGYKFVMEDPGVIDYGITFQNLTNQILSGLSVSYGGTFSNAQYVLQSPITNQTYASNVVSGGIVPIGTLTTSTNWNATSGGFYQSDGVSRWLGVNGNGLTNLNATNLTGSVNLTNSYGTLPQAGLPSGVLTNNDTRGWTNGAGVLINTGTGAIGSGSGQTNAFEVSTSYSPRAIGVNTNGTAYFQNGGCYINSGFYFSSLYNWAYGGQVLALGPSPASIKAGGSGGSLDVNANGAGALTLGSKTDFSVACKDVFITSTNATVLSVNGLKVSGTLTATNGVIQQLKPSFTTNFTCTTNLQFYCCNGTNQVITLPNAANVPNVLYRFSMTNGFAKVILTNATGAQTIRDGSSLSLTLIGIQAASLISDGAHWWNAGKIKTVFPTAQFSCTTNIPMTAATTAYPVTFNSTDFDYSQGIVLAAGTNANGFASKMWITNSGIYEFDPSIVVNFGGNNTVTIWFRKDGVNIPNSATAIKGAAGGSIRCVTIPFVVTVTNAAAYEIWTLSSSTGDSLSIQAAGGVAPDDYPLSPSVICPVKRLSDTWP